MVDFSSIWFYTLSTSAQVLAAVVGLFAVFVIYKLQSITPQLSEMRQDIAERIISYIYWFNSGSHDFPCVINLADHKDWKEKTYWLQKSDKNYVKYFKKLLSNNASDCNAINLIKGLESPGQYLSSFTINEYSFVYFKMMVDSKSRILNSLLLILVLNVTSILYCIILLTISEKVLEGCFGNPYGFLLINTILMPLSLIIVGYQIYSICKK